MESKGGAEITGQLDSLPQTTSNEQTTKWHPRLTGLHYLAVPPRAYTIDLKPQGRGNVGEFITRGHAGYGGEFTER